MSQSQRNKTMQRSKSSKEKPSYMSLLQVEPKSKAKLSIKNVLLSKRDQIAGGRLLNDQPNSQRTVNPSLQELEHHRSVIGNISLRGKQSAGVINPDPDNILTYYKDALKQRKSVQHKRSHQSFRFTDNPTSEKEKRAKKVAPYGQENLMSNILSPSNRSSTYIQPDAFYEKARSMKFFSDFSSKVSCLPGSYTREVKEDPKPLRKHIISAYINENTSLVSNHPEREMNCFSSGKRITHNILEESKDTKEEFYLGKRHIHPGIKSQFKSQFEIE